LEFEQLEIAEGVEYRDGGVLLGRLVWVDAWSGDREAAEAVRERELPLVASA
jgi:hypothetical protein